MTNSMAKRAALYIGILAFALVLLLFLGASQASAEEVTSDITVDTTWSSGGVYNISADVTVVDGVTLEIENNVTVMFNGTYYLIVEGTMYVNGTADQPVVFTNNASMGYGGGIEYADGSSGSISHASISHVLYGLIIRNESIPCSNLLINDTLNYGLYFEFFGAEQNVVLSLADITITDASTALYANNDNGTLDVSLVRFLTDGTIRVASLSAFGFNDTGAVSLRIHESVLRSTVDGIWIDAKTVGLVEVLDSELIVESGTSYYFILGSNFDSAGDMSIILDNVTFDAIGGAVFALTTGDITASFNEVSVLNMYVFSRMEATNVDLSVTNSNFVNSSGGFWVIAYENANVEIVDSSFENDPSYFTMSVLTAPLQVDVMNGAADILLDNSLFENFEYGVRCTVYSGDISLQAISSVFDGIDNGAALSLNALNGSIGAHLDGVQVANAITAGDFNAQHVDGTAVIDLTVVGCSFTSVENGVIAISDTIGNVQVSDSTVIGEWYPITLQGSVAFEIIGNYESEITTVVFDNVIAEDIGTVFIVDVVGDLDLTIDSVVTNSTGTVGSFEALNLGQNATMNIVVVNSSFSNTTTGLVFITNILDPDFSLLGTNTFTNIFGQSLIMQADLGDVVMNFEQFMMTNGGGISVFIGFGNIEVNIIDSMMDLSGAGTVLDLFVNSNTLDNGFITLNVVNSTLSDAENGIRTYSEELVITAMDDVNFVNMFGTALHFDVRSATSSDRVLTIALNNVMGENLGAGMFLYLNDGSLDLTIADSHLQTEFFGVQVEVSCVLPDDLSVIDLAVSGSVFEDGIYGIYATSVNGGTAVITGSEFLGHSGVGYWFDSLYGEMDVEITDSVFDGSSGADITVYMVEEVENTFQLIGRNYWTMGVDAWTGGTVTIDLPFVFSYDGVEYTSVEMNEDGGLWFDDGEAILPVGETNLIYNYEQFFGYKVAEDGMSVMFHWYASESYYGFSLSSVFQVVLFADGTIQFNYGDMDAYSYDVEFGLMTGNGPTSYDLGALYDMPKWEADWMAFLFTPLPISYGMGALLTMEEGNISAVITNNTVTSYYNGGIAVLSLEGGMDVEVTGNEFSKIVGYEYAALHLSNYNGESDVTMADNSFERIWGLAIYLYMSSTHGGVKSVDMSDSVFNKVGYVLYSVIQVWDNTDRTGNDTLDVTVNFQNNVLTDAYGLVCWIYLYLYDEVDWTVNVEQTMTNNVMVQENYMGSWPFDTMYPTSSALGSGVYIEKYDESGSSVTLTQTATVTGNHIESPGPWGIDIGNTIYNDYGDTTRNAAIDVSDNLVNCTWEDGIYVWSEMYMAVGNVVDDVSITIEGNEINDGTQSIYAITVYACVDSYEGTSYDQSGDADINTFVSISDNLVEGAYMGVYSEMWFYQDNIVGDWNVVLTSHIDRNQLLNVSYAVEAYLYAGPYFSNNYWPPENETAVANFVLDYLYTVDDNVVTCPYYLTSWEEMIYVEIEYWAWISTGTVAVAAESYAWINGAISISGNDITLDGYIDGIYLFHYAGAQKSSWIWVDVDVAVDDNMINTIDEDGYAYDAIYLENEIEVQCNDHVITEVGATVDMTWSVTGNQISGAEYGIWAFDDIEIYNGVSSYQYDVVWDISGNTLTDIGDSGIGYELSRDDSDTYGAIEMNVAVNIDNNIISMEDRDDTYYGIYLDSWYYTDSWEYWDEQNGNHTFVASISGNTISHAYYGMYVYGTLYFDVPDDYEPTGDEVFYTYVNDIVIENNYVNDSWYGMYLEDAMDVRNNIIENEVGAPTYGIFWYEAEGEMVGNTITADYTVEIEYLHHLLMQDNLFQFGATGVYIYYYDYEEDADGVIIDNIITAMENPFLPWSSFGIELYYVPNLLIANNVISGADYGIDMYDVWNVTIEGNEISAYEDGIYIYYSWFVWVESNEITGCGDGLYISSYVEDLVVGNNTFMENGYAIYMYEEVHRMVLWNNVFIDNEYGTDIYSYLYMEAVWYVDAQCQSSRSDIDFNGPIYVLAGGSMVLEDMCLWVEGGITVDEGGLLSMSAVYVDECWFIDVAGTFWASLSVFDETAVNLGPTAEAEIRTSTFYWSDMLVDGCSPVIADNLFLGYGAEYGIVVKNGAAPSIVSNIIALYAVGIYANGMDMGGIYDNLIVGNSMAGLLAESCTGAIHDNIFLLNKVEILLRNSDVSVEDNEIGYTNIFQVIANYAPILGHFVNLGGEDSETTTADPQAAMDSILSSSWSDIGSWVKAHNGIWSEGSVVRTSGNVYGLVNYALYAVDSEIHFADDVRTIVLTVPHANEGQMYNYSLNLYTLNGLYAARSQVWVDGSTIEVLDDALVFESSEAWVEGATLLAGDFDYLVFGGSDVYNIATTYAKAKVMDSHSLNEGTWLTITFLDEGDPAVNISVLIKNGKGEIVFNGTTDADGKVRILLIQYAYTSEGKDDGFNPYTITADFESGEKSVDVTLDQSYQELTIEGEEESDMGAILAVVGVLVIILLIVAAVVVMRRRK
jgi:parallel beta-helix repeat protein